MRAAAMAACTLLMASSCKVSNPAFCSAERPCTEPGTACDDVQHECVPTADAAGCTSSAECSDGSRPICDVDAMICRPCVPGVGGDAACAGRDLATLRCETDGRCVECLGPDDCGSTAPVCQGGMCRGCELHDDCSSELCDRSTGSCAATEDVIYVATNGVDGAGCGGQTSPCSTISGVQGALPKVGGTRRLVRIRTGVYGESVRVDIGGAVALIGPGAVVQPQAASNTPGLRVMSASDVLVDGLTIAGASGGTASLGIYCDGSSSLTIREATIANNEIYGIRASFCALTLTRSLVSSNGRGGVYVLDSAFNLSNNVLFNNGQVGSGGSIFGGLLISNSGVTADEQLLEFNTIVDSESGPTAVTNSVECNTLSAVAARNNIVYYGLGGTDAVAGNCAWTYSDVEGGVAGTGNIDLDPMFVDAPGGDFHLGETSPCRDAADPTATLGVDFEGDARPQNGRHDMGADEFVP